MREVLESNRKSIEESMILEKLELRKNQYILLSAHREENIDKEDNFISLMGAINEIAEIYQMPIIFSTHPRSRKMLENRRFKFHPLVRSLEPFGFFDYNKLQKEAYCVLSDSGTLSEESAIIGFPSVLIRTSTERPEVLDKGTIVIGGIKKDTICQAIRLAVDTYQENSSLIISDSYKDRNVSIKIVKIIQSYTDIVNRTVWRK